MDTKVELCGISLKNPIIAASGTFAFGEYYDDYFDVSKMGGISLKALTAEKREGNPPPRIAESASGVLNAVGLQNPGIDAFLADIYPEIKELDTCLITNVSGSTIEDYLRVIEKLEDTDIPIIELNVSCPNVKCGGMQFGATPELAAEATQAARKATRKQLMVKLSPNVTDIAAIASAVESEGADAVSLVNTFAAMAIDAKTRKPILSNVTGGLSGPAIKPIALRMVNQVFNAVKIPVVGMGGIMHGIDVAEFMIAGATAVMVGTANMVSPSASLRIAKEFEAFLTEQNIERASDLTGSLVVD
ncbi:MAG: dihydroorotate dehydrogenase [Eubacteriales bacterium]